MWDHREQDAYGSVSLHDCRARDIRPEGAELVFDFPDGFLLVPGSGCTPRVFRMVTSGRLSPMDYMLDILHGTRYAPIAA